MPGTVPVPAKLLWTPAGRRGCDGKAEDALGLTPGEDENAASAPSAARWGVSALVNRRYSGGLCLLHQNRHSPSKKEDKTTGGSRCGSVETCRKPNAVLLCIREDARER